MLLSFNLFCLAWILASLFDENGATPNNGTMNYNVIVFEKKDPNKIFNKTGEFTFRTMDDMYQCLKAQKINELIKDPKFPLKEISERYSYMQALIAFGMQEEENTFQIPKTRTGKVYRTYRNDKKLWYNSHNRQNISVRITETETEIKIELETPMAIVELIEEVKNEGLKLYNEYYELKNIEQNLNEDTYKIIENKFQENNYYEEMLKKYKNFIVEFKKRWFRALFNFVYKKICENTGNVIIKSREEENGERNLRKRKRFGEEKIIYFNPQSLNTNSFWGDEGTKNSAINPTVTGDASTSRH
uniref:Uncharacterized protein n=1 Tax=Meloidogyne hapla TaxID=6305 RepID=A0A1I8BX32_MELHA